jgi:hypothetical protein
MKFWARNLYAYDLSHWTGIGNDIADATTSIQAAIDSAYALKQNLVIIPPGTYKVSAQLNYYSGITVRGYKDAVPPYGGTIIKAYHNGDVFKFDKTKDTSFAHFGGIENLSIIAAPTFTPASGINIYQPGENCVISDVSMQELNNGIVTGDNTGPLGVVSLTVRNLTAYRCTGSVLRFFQPSAGLINISSLSGDDNLHMMHLNGGGESISVNVQGIKAESNAGGLHDPLILLENAACSLNMFGGWVSAVVPLADVIKFTVGGRPRVIWGGIKALQYTNLLNDTLTPAVVSAMIGPLPRTSFIYNTAW